MPGRTELPGTLRRSPAKARRTWIEAHDSAVEQHGEGRRAHQVAFALLDAIRTANRSATRAART